MKKVFAIILVLLNTLAWGQYKFSDIKERVKPFAMVQVWGRYAQLNPGTTVNGLEKESYADISIRRYRLGFSAMVTDKLYTMVAVGDNNINTSSSRGGISLLDFLVEYRSNDKLHFGGGKTAWRGLSRYAAISTSKMLSLDAPFMCFTTINKQDHLLRKLNVYAKGQLQRLDYRVAVASPFEESTATVIENQATYQFNTGELNYSGYMKYQFFEKESNNSAYSVATYLGNKKVLSVGGGVEYQKNVTAYSQGENTIQENMFLANIDMFLELPTGKGRAVTSYLSVCRYDYGKNYLRSIGPNSLKVDPSTTTINGSGITTPFLGTGNSMLFQLAYLKPIGEGDKKIQFASTTQISDYEFLDEYMIWYSCNVNLYLNDHGSKFAFGYQNRPVFVSNPDLTNTVASRKGVFILQYQFRFE